eukprot:1273527-Amphidinium_carterae.1
MSAAGPLTSHCRRVEQLGAETPQHAPNAQPPLWQGQEASAGCLTAVEALPTVRLAELAPDSLLRTFKDLTDVWSPTSPLPDALIVIGKL